MEALFAIIGFVLALRGGFSTALIFAFIGYNLGHALREVKRETAQTRPRGSTGPSYGPHRQGRDAGRAYVFCTTAAAMLAKMAKVDGRVTENEISAVERAFGRLGFYDQSREFAIKAFRKAKDDPRTIYAYASEFARTVRSVEVRELFYELLWDLACSDGVVSDSENEILMRITGPLQIAMDWYYIYANERLGTRYHRGNQRQERSSRSSSENSYRHSEPPPRPRDELSEAYAILGVPSTASNDEVKRAYREKAKKCHPDVLRAQGLPEEMIGKANEQMARVNEAWGRIKSARGL